MYPTHILSFISSYPIHIYIGCVQSGDKSNQQIYEKYIYCCVRPRIKLAWKHFICTTLHHFYVQTDNKSNEDFPSAILPNKLHTDPFSLVIVHLCFPFYTYVFIQSILCHNQSINQSINGGLSFLTDNKQLHLLARKFFEYFNECLICQPNAISLPFAHLHLQDLV